MDEENEGKSDAEYLSSGIKTAGAITLGIAASAATGFGATVIISAVGALLPVAADMLARGLSLNENRRVSGVQRLAQEAFEFKIAAGKRLRTDGFFNSETGVRSSADEIFEGVLQVARSEHEETKLPYVAHLCASIAFDDSISRGEANRLIRQIESLTYRQLCILAAVSSDSYAEGWRVQPFNTAEGTDELASVLSECFELESQGLLGQKDNGASMPFLGAPSWACVIPANLKVAKHGQKLVNLAQLSRISETDIHEISAIMKEER